MSLMAERRGDPDSDGAAPGASEYRTVFVDTSLDSHLAVILSYSDTVSDFKEKIMREHGRCFPKTGKIEIHSLKVKRRGNFYHLPDVMLVRNVFHGVKGNWFLDLVSDANVISTFQLPSPDGGTGQNATSKLNSGLKLEKCSEKNTDFPSNKSMENYGETKLPAKKKSKARHNQGKVGTTLVEGTSSGSAAKRSTSESTEKSEILLASDNRKEDSPIKGEMPENVIVVKPKNALAQNVLTENFEGVTLDTSAQEKKRKRKGRKEEMLQHRAADPGPSPPEYDEGNRSFLSKTTDFHADAHCEPSQVPERKQCISLPLEVTSGTTVFPLKVDILTQFSQSKVKGEASSLKNKLPVTNGTDNETNMPDIEEGPRESSLNHDPVRILSENLRTLDQSEADINIRDSAKSGKTNTLKDHETERVESIFSTAETDLNVRSKEDRDLSLNLQSDMKLYEVNDTIKEPNSSAILMDANDIMGDAKSNSNKRKKKMEPEDYGKDSGYDASGNHVDILGSTQTGGSQQTLKDTDSRKGKMETKNQSSGGNCNTDLLAGEKENPTESLKLHPAEQSIKNIGIEIKKKRKKRQPAGSDVQENLPTKDKKVGGDELATEEKSNNFITSEQQDRHCCFIPSSITQRKRKARGSFEVSDNWVKDSNPSAMRGMKAPEKHDEVPAASCWPKEKNVSLAQSIVKRSETFPENRGSKRLRQDQNVINNIVVKTPQKESLFTKSGAIFQDNSVDNSADDSDAANHSSSDSSSLSGYSTGGSDLNQYSDTYGSNNAKRRHSGGESMSKLDLSASKDMAMDMILRSSKRFKKAKLIASQYEQEQMEFVPDSQLTQ
ncbi:UNVERIFIED_CONTAM: hypothetical protein Slati_1848400 [Sesamum latifolium]|uniref:Uncharacterized protein n=1 Tax=Sesamum latifolium TaxID=2727402 RepID=A0AAW2WZR9_9LAMI